MFVVPSTDIDGSMDEESGAIAPPLHSKKKIGFCLVSAVCTLATGVLHPFVVGWTLNPILVGTLLVVVAIGWFIEAHLMVMQNKKNRALARMLNKVLAQRKNMEDMNASMENTGVSGGPIKPPTMH